MAGKFSRHQPDERGLSAVAADSLVPRRIDSHVHLYPPELNRNPAGWAAVRSERHWSTLALRRRRNGSPVQTFPGLAELLHALDGAGVERAVLLGWYWEQPASCREHNRFAAECVRLYPDRLAAFATLHPAAGEAAVATEMNWAREVGFSGLGELSPHSQGYGVDDPIFRMALERAGEWGWPVNLHVTDPASRPYPGSVATPLADFLRLARACPATRFILAHWGGLLAEREPAAGALPNLYYDTAASPLTYDAGIWRRLVSQVGAERVVFGSDYPLNLYPALDAAPTMGRLIAEAENAGLTPAEETALFAGTFESLVAPGRSSPGGSSGSRSAT
jgi:predicted TIM-barrel fold metal-dependent hydrolase